MPRGDMSLDRAVRPHLSSDGRLGHPLNALNGVRYGAWHRELLKLLPATPHSLERRRIAIAQCAQLRRARDTSCLMSRGEALEAVDASRSRVRFLPTAKHTLGRQTHPVIFYDCCIAQRPQDAAFNPP